TSSFEGAYRALYHRLPQGVPIEALNWRVTVAGPPATLAMTPTHSRERNSDRGIKTTRKGWFAETAAFVDTPVYDRYALGPGVEFVGPAIVEERESTAVLGPGARCRVDGGLAIVVEMPDGSASRAAPELPQARSLRGER